MVDLVKELGNLAGLAIKGRPQDIQLFLRRLARRSRGSYPELADRIQSILLEAPLRSFPIRDLQVAEPVADLPVDEESRLELLRVEHPAVVEREPIWAAVVRETLDQIVLERERAADLLRRDLTPSRSALFHGPPGVGKSLAARWIAKTLGVPLLTLDLSAVVSSFLGKTGVNIRQVLTYAKGIRCVLLLDELDAIAKRRDDDSEIGELKRLVTVLLQEIDDWPATGLLIGATNHEGLLDPAIWRRFDIVLAFAPPTEDHALQLVRALVGEELDDHACQVLAIALRGESFATIERDILRIRRYAIVKGLDLLETASALINRQIHAKSLDDRRQVATHLMALGLTQSKIHEITGLHRDVIRKMQAREGRNGRKR